MCRSSTPRRLPMRRRPTHCVVLRRIGIAPGSGGAAEELAGADGEEGAAAGPDAALARDQAAARARRGGLPEQPRLFGHRPVERHREVDARGDVRAAYVVLGRGRPAERVEQDQRAAGVEPGVVERGSRHEAVPLAELRLTAGAVLPVVDPAGRALVEVRPERERAASRPSRRAARRSTAATRAREPPASAVTSCSRPATSPTDHTIASKIGRPCCVIETRIDSRALRLAQGRDLEVDGRVEVGDAEEVADEGDRPVEPGRTRRPRAARSPRRSRRSVPRSPSRATSVRCSGRRRPRPRYRSPDHPWAKR